MVERGVTTNGINGRDTNKGKSKPSLQKGSSQ